MTFAEWKRAIANAYWDLNYEAFCGRAGFAHDSYAEDKWRSFRALALALNEFDDNTLERIVSP